MSQKIEVIKSWLGNGSVNIFGLPFSGKDTHGRELANVLDGPLLGGGEILRSSIIPRHVKLAMEQGNLVPSQDYVDIVLPFFSKPEFKTHPLILSSVGRWIGEEQGVIEATQASGHPIRAVVYLQIDPLEARQRWELAQEHDRGSRTDDAEHLLENRFTEFMTKTVPVLQIYEDKGLLIEIDARPAKAEVTDEIINRLFDFANKS